jgi:hypothetical protein
VAQVTPRLEAPVNGHSQHDNDDNNDDDDKEPTTHQRDVVDVGLDEVQQSEVSPKHDGTRLRWYLHHVMTTTCGADSHKHHQRSSTKDQNDDPSKMVIDSLHRAWCWSMVHVSWIRVGNLFRQ